MRLLIVLFASFLLSTAAAAATVLDDKGRPDALLVAQFVATFAPQIGDYPPVFSSREQQEQVHAKTLQAVQELTSADLSAVRDQALLANIAQVFSMAHNLDLGTSQQAKSTFEQALALDPENRRTNYLFGMHLVSTRAYHFQSLPYLQKALALGERDAMYTIGLLMVQSGETEAGLEVLQAYADKAPQPETALRLIQTINAGKLGFGVK